MSLEDWNICKVLELPEYGLGALPDSLKLAQALKSHLEAGSGPVREGHP